MDVLYINEFGAKIIKGCLSCRHKAISTQGERRCRKTNTTITDKYSICDNWVLISGYENAKKQSNGKVDPHCYEKFVKLRDNLSKKQQWLRGFIKDCEYEASEQKASTDKSGTSED